MHRRGVDAGSDPCVKKLAMAARLPAWLTMARNTANEAVLAEGKTQLVADPQGLPRHQAPGLGQARTHRGHYKPGYLNRSHTPQDRQRPQSALSTGAAFQSFGFSTPNIRGGCTAPSDLVGLTRDDRFVGTLRWLTLVAGTEVKSCSENLPDAAAFCNVRPAGPNNSGGTDFNLSAATEAWMASQSSCALVLIVSLLRSGPLNLSRATDRAGSPSFTVLARLDFGHWCF